MEPTMPEKQYQIEHWTKTLAVADYEKQDPMVVTVNDRAGTRQAIIEAIQKRSAEFIERSGWSALKTVPSKTENDWHYRKIAIHHVGRNSSCGLGRQQMQEIQKMHLSKTWGDIGYHYGIDCNGSIFEGTDIRNKGTNLEMFNTSVIGIVLLANLAEPSDNLDGAGLLMGAKKFLGLSAPTVATDSQKSSLKNLIESLRQFFQIGELGGHCEFPRQNSNSSKICPGFNGLKLVEELRTWSKLAYPI